MKNDIWAIIKSILLRFVDSLAFHTQDTRLCSLHWLQRGPVLLPNLPGGGPQHVPPGRVSDPGPAARLRDERHLSLRLTTRLTAGQLLEIRPRLKEPASGPYSGEDYANIYRLVSHEERKTPEALFPLTLMAVFMLRCLQFQGYFGDGEFQGYFGDGERPGGVWDVIM